MKPDPPTRLPVVIAGVRHLLMPAQAALAPASTRSALLALAALLERDLQQAAIARPVAAPAFGHLGLAAVMGLLLQDLPTRARQAGAPEGLERRLAEFDRLVVELRFKTFGSVLAGVDAIARVVAEPARHDRAAAALASASMQLSGALQRPGTPTAQLESAGRTWMDALAALLRRPSPHGAQIVALLRRPAASGASVFDLVMRLFLHGRPCGARHRAQTAAHLLDHVIPHVPVSRKEGRLSRLSMGPGRFALRKSKRTDCCWRRRLMHGS